MHRPGHIAPVTVWMDYAALLENQLSKAEAVKESWRKEIMRLMDENVALHGRLQDETPIDFG